jgi:hypothetical protein
MHKKTLDDEGDLQEENLESKSNSHGWRVGFFLSLSKEI